MGQTTTWQIPYPDLSDPADIVGQTTGRGIDDLAIRIDTCLSQVRSQGAIPGEIKLWSGSALPDLATYGHWVWADGAPYVTATYPKAAAAIAAGWRTFAGASDPGAGNFRVPDLRGLVPAGLDQMPGGARANRMTRAVAITLAGKTGEETHIITLAESAAHAHGVTDPQHTHATNDPGHYHGGVIQAGTVGGTANTAGGPTVGTTDTRLTGIGIYNQPTGISIQNAGGGGAHENVQPTVFVPYIVKLDD